MVNCELYLTQSFMNELSIIFNMLGIDTHYVLEAARTKWNFLDFTPGLVGGHCIGVDPYYLTYKAEQIGYHSQIILAGRRINDGMGKYVAENVVKNMIKADKPVKGSTVAVFGITFKENCPDVRNTKVVDIIDELEEYGVQVKVVDPIADEDDLWHTYGIRLSEPSEVEGVDAVIFAVAHNEFKNYKLADIKRLYNEKHNVTRVDEVAVANEGLGVRHKEVLVDVKGIFDRKEAESLDFLYWRL